MKAFGVPRSERDMSVAHFFVVPEAFEPVNV